MKKKEKRQKSAKEERCICPYCEEELIVANLPYCQACAIVFRQCVRCQITVLDKEAANCPKCGEPLS
jgi:hypothetical protein